MKNKKEAIRSETICRICNKEIDDKGKKEGETIQHCNMFHVVGNKINMKKEIENEQKRKKERQAKIDEF